MDLQLPPRLASLTRALGLVGPDGGVDAGWFEHPLDRVQKVLARPHQRAALFQLLDGTLPPESAGDARGGARWHPLLDAGGRGNVYVTVDGGRVGVAAAIETPADVLPRVRASLRLPLVDTAGGAVVAVAGSPGAPLEVALEAGLGAGAHPSSVAVVASVDVEGNGSVRIVLEDLDPASPAGTRTELDPSRLDADAVRVIEGLLRRVLAEAAGGAGEAGRVPHHLPGVLGLDPALPALPLARVLADPGALRGWLAAIAADGDALSAWFGHLAGLLGAGPADGAPAVSGDGTVARPFRVPLLALEGGVTLDVTLAAGGEPSALRLGLGFTLKASAGTVEAAATLAAIPLAGTASAAVLPDAHLRLLTPASGPIVDEPAIRLGSVSAGMAWDGARLAPRLELLDVRLQGSEYPRLDLSSANAVVDAASEAVGDALRDAVGEAGAGRALLALVGLLPPRLDGDTTHALDLAALVRDPLAAIADVHRGALADARRLGDADEPHGWEHLFAEVAALLGVTVPVDGTGTALDPWRVPLAGEAGAALELVAWNAAESTAPAGAERLRLGLRMAVGSAPWQAEWRTELLAFDLAPEAPAARFLGGHHLSVSLSPVSTPATGAGIAFAAASVAAAATWAPGQPARVGVRVHDLTVTGGTESVGPVSLHLPAPSFDPAAPDLGLGVAPETLTALLRLLMAEALRGWGGDAAFVLGGVLGIHRRLGGLPADWPLLEAPDGIGALLEDPFAAFRLQAERVMGGSAADGTPFILAALPWLRALLADELPTELGTAPTLDLGLPGGGTYAHPWTLPLGEGGAELVCWMEPDGPPAAWQRGRVARLRAARDGASLYLHLRDALALLPEVEGALEERGGSELDRLARWLARGDGMVSAASAGLVGAGWTRGTPVDAPHLELPSAPAAIEQVRARLNAWAGEGTPRGVVLLSPPFADHTAWSGYVQAAEPGRPADAHFDFRAPGVDPLAVELGHVDGVATHYTADLAYGDPESVDAQLLRVAERVRALTGQARLHLVAHSTAGLAARAFAAEHPELVAGIITLGTPHGGGVPAPLADPVLADAVRFAAALLPAEGRGPLGRAVAALAAMLDDPARYPAESFAAEWVRDAVPGFAIAGMLAGELIPALAASLADRATAVAEGAAPPTHLGYGARVALPLPEAAPGEVRVRGRVRVDAGRRALDGGAAEPARAPRAVQARVEVDRAGGGWLAGEAGGESPVRLRRAELGVDVEPAPGGGVSLRPHLRLRDASADRPDVLLDALLERLPSLPRIIPLSSAPPAPGTAAAWLADLLEALGVLVRDVTGAMALSLEELAAGGAAPAARWGGRLPELLSATVTEEGAGWVLRAAGVPLEVRIERDPWRVRVRTRDAATGADSLPLAPGLRLHGEAALAFPGFEGSTAARLELADARLAWSGAAGTLTLAAEPWLEPVALVPPAPAPVLRAALTRAVPLFAASTAVSGVLNGLLGPEVRVRGIARLLTSPGAWLVSPDALGAEGGGLDPARVTALLEAVGTAVGMPAEGGLRLPGGLELTADGENPLTLRLTGILPLNGAGELDLGLFLAIDRALAVTPAGTATVRVTGLAEQGWQDVAITVGADPAGLSLSVTPGQGARIDLLPRFSGFGALAEGAAALLPAVLQAVVEALEPDPLDTTGMLRVALELARALEIYGFDAQGFGAPARAARLQAMLQPGWLQREADGSAVMAALGALFADPDDPTAAPLLDLPGEVTADDDGNLRWSFGIGAGRVFARVGWTGDGAEAGPALVLGVADLRLGAIVVGAVEAGYDGGIACGLDLSLEQADGALAFLRPALAAGVADGRFSLDLLPLGAGTGGELTVHVAPEPAVVMGPGGPLALAERWALPLAANLLLREFGDRLEAPLYANGPTLRQVLDGSGLLRDGVHPPVLVPALPAPEMIALGALRAAVREVRMEVVPGLWLSLVADGSRLGIRLEGRQALSEEIGIRFGGDAWLGGGSGVTLWLLDDDAQTPFAPALDVAGLGVELAGADGAPLLDGAFQVGRASGCLFLHADFLEGGEPTLRVGGVGAGAQLRDGRIRVSADDADSFLKSVLPPELQAPFDLGVAWRDGRLALHGGTPGKGLELTFPLDLDLSVIRLSELFLALRGQGGAAVVEAGLSGGASLGLVRAAVQRVGVRATLGGGVQVGFRAPDGVGITIDAGMVSGGGYLEVDRERGQYAGALQLQLQGLSLAAIGILNTRAEDGSPLLDGDGSPTFSFLVIIAAELPPIQLGFGFTLNGIGGLLGLNRTINEAALQAGVRNRGLDAILFPRDPVANAPALVRTLNTVFPLAPGRLLVGPMVRLAWGTPAILTMDLAILVELPGPARVAVLGRMRLALPREDDRAVVVINLDVGGVVNFEAGTVSFDAVLYDSVIAGFALTGGMALRASWKEKPAFALAVGGFHPAFQPPPGFPTLERVALSLSSGNNPRLRMEAYMAVTSNTVQFGAAVDLHAEALGFEVDGHLGFDALIYLDPFGLDVSLDASVSVKWNGSTVCAVGLHLRVRGPGPWHIQGRAHIELLLVSATVRFDARIGKAAPPPPPPPVRVDRLLAEALAAPENWSAQPPVGEAVVSLRSRPGGARPAAHPLGGLTLRQRVVPLEVDIERFGAASVEGAKHFAITDVRMGHDAVTKEKLETLRDPFAAGQFFSLTDSQKLSRPSFEPYVSGVGVRFDGFEVDGLGAGEAAALGYEVVVVDEDEDGTVPAGLTLTLAPDVAAEQAHTGAAALAESRRSGPRRFATAAATVRVTERGFTVAPAEAPAGAAVAAPTFMEALQGAERAAGDGVEPVPAAAREEL